MKIALIIIGILVAIMLMVYLPWIVGGAAVVIFCFWNDWYVAGVIIGIICIGLQISIGSDLWDGSGWNEGSSDDGDSDGLGFAEMYMSFRYGESQSKKDKDE